MFRVAGAFPNICRCRVFPFRSAGRAAGAVPGYRVRTIGRRGGIVRSDLLPGAFASRRNPSGLCLSYPSACSRPFATGPCTPAMPACRGFCSRPPRFFRARNRPPRRLFSLRRVVLLPFFSIPTTTGLSNVRSPRKRTRLPLAACRRGVSPVARTAAIRSGNNNKTDFITERIGGGRRLLRGSLPSAPRRHGGLRRPARASTRSRRARYVRRSPCHPAPVRAVLYRCAKLRDG